MISRRSLVGLAGLTAGALAIRPQIIFADTLAEMDPFAPLKLDAYLRLRKLMQQPTDGEALVKNLWERYVQTGKFDYGHWAVCYSQLWWQAHPPGKDRLRVSQIGRAMAEKLRTDFPAHPAGYFWSAAHMGFEALVRGVLDSLNMIPQFFNLLDEAEARDPGYLLGSVHLAKAKAYLKLPSFPMSIGSVDKGLAQLEKAKPYQEKRYALWYIVLAEAEMQRQGKEAALQALHGLDQVCPQDMQSQYTFEISTLFAEKFRHSVATGKYNKYTWDPMLESIIELRDRQVTIAKGC